MTFVGEQGKFWEHGGGGGNGHKPTAKSGLLHAALLGQVASLLLATVGACSESLSRQV